MSLQEFVKKLKSVGIPIAHYAFPASDDGKSSVKPPYMVYMGGRDENISGDEDVFGKMCGIRVELYMKKRNKQLEGSVETIIGEIDSKFTTDETYITESKLIMKIYEFEMEE